MAVQGKLETVVELKNPAEKFYNLWKDQTHHVSKHSPNHVQEVNLHQGDWGTHGSIKVWNYTVDGKTEVFKEKVAYDDVNKKITHQGLEGDVLKIYKVYKGALQFIPKEPAGSLAILTIEYEKLNANVPVPEKYLDVMVNIVKDIDSGLV